jgi:hypothetical protein
MKVKLYLVTEKAFYGRFLINNNSINNNIVGWPNPNSLPGSPSRPRQNIFNNNYDNNNVGCN